MFSVNGDPLEKIKKEGFLKFIPENVIEAVLNTPALSDEQLKRFLENRPEDKEKNELIKRWVHIIPDLEDKTKFHSQYKNLFLAFRMNPSYRKYYKRFIFSMAKDREEKKFVKEEMESSQEEQGAVLLEDLKDGAYDDVQSMDRYPNDVRNLERQGRITPEQKQKSLDWYNKNNWSMIPSEYQTTFKYYEKSSRKLIDSITNVDIGPGSQVRPVSWVHQTRKQGEEIKVALSMYSRQFSKHLRSQIEGRNGSMSESIYSLKMDEFWSSKINEIRTKNQVTIYSKGKRKVLKIPSSILNQRGSSKTSGSTQQKEKSDKYNFSNMTRRELLERGSFSTDPKEMIELTKELNRRKSKEK